MILLGNKIDFGGLYSPDVNSLLGTQLVGDVGKVSTNQRKGDDEPILGGEFQTHLEVVLKELAVEAEEGEVRCLNDHFIEVVDHPGVEADGVQQSCQVSLLLQHISFATGEIVLQPIRD